MGITANDFWEFVKTSESALAHFAAVAKEFAKGRDIEFTPPPAADGPKQWAAGDKHELTTVGISVKDLDALIEREADEAVKAQLRSFIHGLIVGATL